MSAVILRTSERTAFKRCPARWWWSYREGLKPKSAESTPLWFGTGVHLAFAEWYLPGTKRGPHPAETFAKFAGDALHVIKTSDADASEERVAEYEDGRELGIRLMEEYVKEYGRDSKWSFISAEQRFSIDIPWPEGDRQQVFDVDEDSGILVEYDGTFDGVYRDLETGRLELLETKTAKSIMTTHLTLDDQAGSYWAVAHATLLKQGLIKASERIAGINYNFVRKALPDERPRDAEGYACNKPVKASYIEQLGAEGYTVDPKSKLEVMELAAKAAGVTVLGERSKVQPLPIFVREMVNRTRPERATQMRRIQDEAVHMAAVRNKLLPILKTPTRDCSRFCDHFQMCELQERGGDWESFKQVAYRVQDPYADHRKSTEE